MSSDAHGRWCPSLTGRRFFGGCGQWLEWQTGRMGFYKEVETLVRAEAGFVPKPCWIAHVLELNGLRPRVAYNRISPNNRKFPCPPDKRPAIESAMRKLGRIPRSKREDTNQPAYRVMQEVIKRSEK